ncbi:undecaprenyl-diphosphate phosphatase [Acidomonas methanolica]|uniref:Undecaprenyl-diphosphatase n=1 Tax=Acidomonas methanolica NBRC 104435 TaxID=1231351 RepID=A0A023D6K0_ACIMT|nr:undecaprenyl-diphosphate phosphatase [Acidomonas methanolica]MBU2653202.1 undecaprenyl-diphosphate phosphatase [Acidomonas methanolica]TCS32151.1 undecaprenyl-diphosphatase [Acidomonas methanolica]GAJ29370.1 undecaprenyl pyrophosphate phosphatase [Acidomonas methanolica NBRC 104435]GBQ49956.1 UDP pyrophosphate phosphatase [Acidomonas methanolica]GEK97585.1 undecaprenyl-diphosphatase [Acidomonas methanolica NBRC 104435]
MTFLQAILLAVIQGITELFPISSLGHAVLVPALLHWNVDEHGDLFLPFLTMLHFGTFVALLLVFAGDWLAIATGVLGRRGPARQEEAIRILVLLVVATVPLVLVGGLFEHRLRAFFGAPLMVAGFLVLNGVLLIATEWLRNHRGRQPHRSIADMSVADAAVIGLWQCLAFLPGISRSGATINGGLLRGLDHETSARFSFLLAQPAILAAATHEAFQLRHTAISHAVLVQSAVAAVIAGITALISTLVLLRYFRNHDNWALSPFAFYCIGAGIVSAVLLFV